MTRNVVGYYSSAAHPSPSWRQRVGQRGWRRVNESELLPPPVRTAYDELATLEARAEMRGRVKARAITPARAHIRRTVVVRSRPVGHKRQRRNIPVRPNVNRARIDCSERNHHAGLGLRG